MSRFNYSRVADPDVDLYSMLGISPSASEERIEDALDEAQRWWNAQQANPRFRRQAPEALARLRSAREVLPDPLKRQEYDRELQALREERRRAALEPIRRLIIKALELGAVDERVRKLINAFAETYNVHEAEVTAMLEDLEPTVTPAPLPAPRRAAARELPAKVSPPRAPMAVSAVMLVSSLLCILYLGFSGYAISAGLLTVPWLNSVRLFATLTVLRPRQVAGRSGALWEWFLGLVLLGGATLGALAEVRATSVFAIGIAASGLAWAAWAVLAAVNRLVRKRVADGDMQK